jgi:hypothetical protein
MVSEDGKLKIKRNPVTTIIYIEKPWDLRLLHAERSSQFA